MTSKCKWPIRDNDNNGSSEQKSETIGFGLENRHFVHCLFRFKLTCRSRLVLGCCETCAETSTKSSSVINGLYLALKFGYINKINTHTYTTWSWKLIISVLTDYYKTVFSVLSRGNKRLIVEVSALGELNVLFHAPLVSSLCDLTSQHFHRNWLSSTVKTPRETSVLSLRKQLIT